MREFFARTRKCLGKPWVMRVGVLLGVAVLLARFCLIGVEMWGHPDPSYFWGGAEDLLRSGQLSDYYFAVFPYMTGYVGVLAGAFGMFGVGGFAAVALNMVLEIVGIVALYALVKKVSGSQKKALWASVLWCFNPFHLVFGVLSMPIVAFDSMLIVVALVAYLMWRSREKKGKFLLYSALLGIVLAVAGWFRPTAPVLIIALVIMYVWSLIRNKWRGWGVVLAGLCIVAGVFFGGTRLEMMIAEGMTGVEGLDSYAGWNVFVGSNEVEDGGWNEEDAKVFWDDYLLNGYTIEEANDVVMRLGVERYAERGLLGNVEFVAKKAWRLAGNVPSAAYYYVQGWGWLGVVILVWLWMWVVMCWAMFVVGVVRGWKGMMKGGFLLFLVFAVLGMFGSGLLVEVMDRYFIPVLCLMFLVGVVGIAQKERNI